MLSVWWFYRFGEVPLSLRKDIPGFIGADEVFETDDVDENVPESAIINEAGVDFSLEDFSLEDYLLSDRTTFLCRFKLDMVGNVRDYRVSHRFNFGDLAKQQHPHPDTVCATFATTAARSPSTPSRWASPTTTGARRAPSAIAKRAGSCSRPTRSPRLHHRRPPAHCCASSRCA
eukprot:Opistho-1_new@101688